MTFPKIFKSNQFLNIFKFLNDLPHLQGVRRAQSSTGPTLKTSALVKP